MTDTNDGPVFRAHKRRKVFRKRVDDDDEKDGDNITPTGPAAAPDGNKDEVEAETKEAAAVQRLRKPTATRRGGVGFSSTSESRRLGGDSGATSANNTDAPGTPLSAVEHAQARFVAPTGHIASSDDKHMMAYVDSKLARLHSSHEPIASQDQPTISSPTTVTTAPKNQDSTSHSHLHEVDATPNPTTTTTTTSPTTTTRSQKRPRKPRPSHRTTADLARDAMVDQILRESNLNLYTPAPSTSNTTTGTNRNADDLMAEEFQRNFYAAAEERANRKPQPPPPARGANSLESLKGPKLGGSRSQRAAMHAAEKAKTGKR